MNYSLLVRSFDESTNLSQHQSSARVINQSNHAWTILQCGGQPWLKHHGDPPAMLLQQLQPVASHGDARIYRSCCCTWHPSLATALERTTLNTRIQRGPQRSGRWKSGPWGNPPDRASLHISTMFHGSLPSQQVDQPLASHISQP